MAATVEASRLTEAHRLAQARLGSITVQRVLASWPLLDVNDLDGSFPRWLRVVAPLVNGQRTVSATLAGNYLTTFRALELGAGVAPFAPIAAEALAADALATSLLVTGPVSIKTAVARGAQVAQAAEVAQASTARAAMRHVLDGGRNTISRTVEEDGTALGWARATSGKTCAFCALVASRGPVYKSKASALQRADGKRYHDGCNCTSEPVYRDDAKWPAGSDRFAEIYAEAKAAEGDTALNFRRLIEAG